MTFTKYIQETLPDFYLVCLSFDDLDRAKMSLSVRCRAKNDRGMSFHRSHTHTIEVYPVSFDDDLIRACAWCVNHLTTTIITEQLHAVPFEEPTS